MVTVLILDFYRIGRKKLFFLALVLLMLTGNAMVIAPHWIIFGILRCLVGFSHPGIISISVVIGSLLLLFENQDSFLPCPVN